MIVTEKGHRPGGWAVSELRGSAGELHGREPGDAAGLGREVWLMAPSAPALVLGSTQADPRTSLGAVSAGIEVVRRRSGGGAVLVDPHDTVWIDVVLRPGDPLAVADVGRSFHWLGVVWADALRAGGLDPVVHRGPLVRTPWSGLVCFAGTGPGEVLVEGRKVVGLSQRRTRRFARFQCAAYVGGDIASIADLLAPVSDPQVGSDESLSGDALRSSLARSVGTVPGGAPALIAAFLDALPA